MVFTDLSNIFKKLSLVSRIFGPLGSCEALTGHDSLILQSRKTSGKDSFSCGTETTDKHLLEIRQQLLNSKPHKTTKHNWTVIHY